MPTAELFVNLLAAYAAAGLVFAAAFVSVGIGKVDPVSKGSRIGFRLIILPGVTALWPLLLLQWIRARGRTS